LQAGEESEAIDNFDEQIDIIGVSHQAMDIVSHQY